MTSGRANRSIPLPPAAGPPDALQQALDVARPGGEVVVIDIPSKDECRLRASRLRRNELALRFCRRHNENCPEAIRLAWAFE